MRSWIAPVLAFLVTFSTLGPRAAATEVEDAIGWLYYTASGPVLRGSQRTMYDGTSAFIPQSGGGYGAFWLRDYSYMLEGRIGVFTDQELIDAYDTFLDAQYSGAPWDGACVDCVKLDGTPIYMPGYGSMGANPVTDGSQFMLDVAWHTYQRTGHADVISTTGMAKLENAMAAVPRSGSGLVYIDPVPAWDRCPYGFTDTVRKQGEVLFSSLLYVQAARQMADLYGAQGNPTAQAAWTTESEDIAQEIRDTFWNASESLFRAATVQCNQPDIWGSAFAVYLGVATGPQSTAVANYFKNNYSGLVQWGQVRHTRPGEYWEVAGTQDWYQNGAYWATPSGWFIYTLDLIDSDLADQTIVDLVTDFQARGVNEFVIGSSTQLPNYCASAALPLDGILRIRDLPPPPPPPPIALVEEGGTYGPDNLALASAGAEPFAVDELDYSGIHTIAHLNDGIYGNEHSWIGVEPSPTLGQGFVGIDLDGVYAVNSIAFSRDNGGEATEYTDRWAGTYRLEYTTVANPDENTPDADWIEIGTLDYFGPTGENFTEPWLRHRYTFDPVVATSLRLIVPYVYSQNGSAATCIDEFEIYGSPVPGDTNLDGNVDQDDLETLATYWGQTGADWSMGDFDGDGVVGPEDAAILAANWGFRFDEGESAAVPEPTSLGLLISGALAALLTLRRRSR